MKPEELIGSRVRLVREVVTLGGMRFVQGAEFRVSGAAVHHLILDNDHTCPTCGCSPQQVRGIRVCDVQVVDQEMIEPEEMPEP